MTLEQLYCTVDDFCKAFVPQWEKELIEYKTSRRRRASRLSESEIMTIIIHFHQSGYRNFKTYYTQHVQRYQRDAFPDLVSYTRFVELMPQVLMLLCFFTLAQAKTKTGLYFIDSMQLKACHIKREKQHRVFKGLAQKSRSSMGWFFGFKIHLIINQLGEVMAFKFTAGNVDDRTPVLALAKGLTGKLVGDKGYIKQALFDALFAKGLQLITKIKKNMKNKLMPIMDKILLRKRAIVESVNDQLKNISQIEHSRHRSVNNFMVNCVAALAAYALKENKPSLHFPKLQLAAVAETF